MNKKRKNKSAYIIIMASMISVLMIAGAVLSFAGESLLSYSQRQVTAGQALRFRVNLSEIKEEYSKASEQFTLTVEIGPSPEAVSVSPNVNISQYGSRYTVSSADMNDISALTFSVYPGTNIKSATSYTVSAKIAGNLSTPSESFSFMALPAQEKKKDDDKKNRNKGNGNKDTKKQNGNNKQIVISGAGAKSGAGSSVSSSMGGSVSSAGTQTVYEGSSDNYLKKLSVTGHKFTKKFNKTRDTYFVKVSDKVKSVKVNAAASDSNAVVRVAGNKNVSKDRSKILVSVTAENGDVRIYRIFVIHTED